MKRQQSQEMHMESQIRYMMPSQKELLDNYKAASNKSATIFVILIIGFTAGPAVSL